MDPTSPNPDDRIRDIIIAMVIPRCFAWIAVTLRIRAKRIGRIEFGWDDYTIFITALLLIPQMINEGVSIRFGLGRHLKYNLVHTPAFESNYFKSVYASQLLYPLLVALIKLSILALYLRIFAPNRAIRLASTIQVICILAWAGVTILLSAFQCSPVRLAWQLNRPQGSCFAFTDIYMGTNVVDLLLCVSILITPLGAIWKLRLGRRKKILVCLVLGVGGGETIISALRLNILLSLPTTDPPWTNATTCLWSTLQINIGVICACLPTLAPLLPKALRHSSRNRNSDGTLGTFGDRSEGGSGSQSQSARTGVQSWRGTSQRVMKHWFGSTGVHGQADVRGDSERKESSDEERLTEYTGPELGFPLGEKEGDVETRRHRLEKGLEGMY